MSGKPLSVIGLSGVSEAEFAYRVSLLTRGLHPVSGESEERFLRQTKIVVVPERSAAERISQDLEFFCGSHRPHRFFSWDVLPFDALSPTIEASAERLHALYQLCVDPGCLVVVTADALLQFLIAPTVLRSLSPTICAGQNLQRDDFILALDLAGYQRSSVVEEIGQVAVRGAVIDFYPAGAAFPVRAELFGDRVNSLRCFQVENQRTIEHLQQVTVIPVREFLRGETPIQMVLSRFRDRARALELPDRTLASLEDALNTGAFSPGIEHLQPLVSGEMATFFDYLSHDATWVTYNLQECVVVMRDYQRLIAERAVKSAEDGMLFPVPESAYQESSKTLAELERRLTVSFESLSLVSLDREESHILEEPLSSEARAEDKDSQKKLHVSPHTALRLALQRSKRTDAPFEPLQSEIKKKFEQGYRVGIVVSHPSRVRRIEQLLSSYELETVEEASFVPWLEQKAQQKAAHIVSLLPGTLHVGISVPEQRFCLIVEQEIFPEATIRKRAKHAKNLRNFLGSVAQLKEDDFVVHVDHGVGVYRGLRQIAVEGKIGDFLHLEYADGDKLFLPVEGIGKIQKYVGGEGVKPTCSKLGTPQWQRTKAKVKEQVAQLAGQLISLYAEREVSSGFAFGAIDVEDAQFADTFAFEETPDQHRAIEDVLTDMAKDKPMDRLVCGDVGYGKTEVALRAAYKAVSGGKQVAILVPTTILADQHFRNFQNRFTEFPIRVGCVSRFFSTDENKQTLLGVSQGTVDIVIGTHRLLQRDVFFKDLGLLVIDEEHRFGVAHKERLKRVRRDVDVLTLTATPIPRTLHMSMMGIRDLSVIETPPVDRQVIQTYLAYYQPGIVREAILREIGRKGQVFYVYNRVETIAAVADEVRELVPEARVEFAHGQMKDEDLEVIMHRFLQGEIDVLVSTTIVESGLDIPNANTIIIRRAEMFGLADLYQLRGRVGRSSRRAYSYLLISEHAKLGPDAKKRLEVLQSLDDLGMGFRLAVQDMEIRGAGNLLGKDQSGQVSLVGFDLYSRILKEVVAEQRVREGLENVSAAALRPFVDPEVNIGFPLHIPPFYIPDVGERLVLYQRLVELRDEEHAREVAEEIEDRFGNPPDEVLQLVEAMVLRSLLRRALVVSLTLRGRMMAVVFHPQAQIDPGRVAQVVGKSVGKMRLSPDMVLYVELEVFEVERPGAVCRVVERVFGEIGVVMA